MPHPHSTLELAETSLYTKRLMKNMLTSKRTNKNFLCLWAALWAWTATIQSLALSTPSHLEQQQHIQPIPRQKPSTEVILVPQILPNIALTHDSMYIRKRMDPTTPSGGSKRNPKAKQPDTARSRPSRHKISPANKSVRTSNPTTNMIHAKTIDNTTKDPPTPHSASKKKTDPPVFAASDTNNHTDKEPPTTVTVPPIKEPPTDPKIIVLAIVGSLGGLACCFCCLLGASRIGCCFLHRFAVRKKDDVVFETVSVGGKKIGPPMPIEDMDEEESKEKCATTTTTDRSKSGKVAFREFWNVPEMRKDGKRNSKGLKTKGRGSLNESGNAKATTTAHYITSPIELIQPQQDDRADSPTIYYNPEFAFSNKSDIEVTSPQYPLAVVVAQTCTDPLKSERMPPSSPHPISKTSESFLSNPSSVSVFPLCDHGDTQQHQSHKRPGPKPHPINTSRTWQTSRTSSSTHMSPTTHFPDGRVGGDEGYFSANPHVALSVHPSPYPPYPPGAYYSTNQQQPVGFDQAQHQHRIQTPFQSQYRSEFGNQDGRYYY